MIPAALNVLKLKRKHFIDPKRSEIVRRKLPFFGQIAPCPFPYEALIYPCPFEILAESLLVLFKSFPMNGHVYRFWDFKKFWANCVLIHM
jgi:hypothetical protein